MLGYIYILFRHTCSRQLDAGQTVKWLLHETCTYNTIWYPTVVFFRVVFLSELRSWEDLKLAWNSALSSQDNKIRPCRLKYSRFMYMSCIFIVNNTINLFVTKQISEFGPISLVFLSHCRFLQRLGRGAFGEAQHRASQQFIGSVDKSKQDCKDTWDLHNIYILCIRILYMYIYISYHVIICISYIKCVYNWLHVHRPWMHIGFRLLLSVLLYLWLCGGCWWLNFQFPSSFLSWINTDRFLMQTLEATKQHQGRQQIVTTSVLH